MAIGLDTSVVLRLLIGEPRAQAARRRIERALIAGAGQGDQVGQEIDPRRRHEVEHARAVPLPDPHEAEVLELL